MVKKKDLYESFELRFNKNNELHMKIWKYLEEKGGVIGKHNYVLQLIFEDYEKSTKK